MKKNILNMKYARQRKAVLDCSSDGEILLGFAK